MNDDCPDCRKPFEQGDFLVVIGMVYLDGHGGLVTIHRDCIMVNVLGEDVASRLIAHERKPPTDI